MWSHYCTRLLGIATAAGFLASVSPVAWSTASAQSATQYQLGVGDTVAVTVYGRAELSGRFPVSPDGTVGFPLLGNVAAAGLTPTELSTNLDRLLAEHVPGLSVAVSVAQYAPVFVVGDVQTPGRYEYRPGMTALELVALGGGTRRVNPEIENTQIQMITARQDYADLELQIFGQQTTRARLQAEVEGSDFSPDKLLTSDPDPSWQTVKQNVIAGERRIFDVQNATLQAEDKALVAQGQSYEDEIKTVNESIELHEHEIELLVEDVAAQKELVSRGVTSKANLRDAERNLSSTRRDALELTSYLARARQNKLAIEQKRVALKTSRLNEAAGRLQEVDLNLARMRARQRSLLATMSELALMSGEAAMDAAQRQPAYSIMRLVDGGRYDDVAAGEEVLLKPGDIVRVVLPQPARTPRSASLN